MFHSDKMTKINPVDFRILKARHLTDIGWHSYDHYLVVRAG